MKKYLICSLFTLVGLNSCSTRTSVNNVSSGRTIFTVDSIYYDGYPEYLRAVEDSLSKVKVDTAKLPIVPDEEQPSLVKSVPPIYPQEARQVGMAGEVWVKLWVDETGLVMMATVLRSSNSIFNQSSLFAAMNWRFSPAKINGKPVRVTVAVPMHFKPSHSQ